LGMVIPASWIGENKSELWDKGSTSWLQMFFSPESCDIPSLTEHASVPERTPTRERDHEGLQGGVVFVGHTFDWRDRL